MIVKKILRLRCVRWLLAGTMLISLLSGCGTQETSPAPVPATVPVPAAQPQISYPESEVRMIVPFGAGGANDVLARMVSEGAKKHLGQQIVVDNVPGGGQLKGQLEFLQQKADGYTLVAINPGIMINPLLNKADFKYTEFRPVVVYNLDPEILVVPANSPYADLKAFLEAAKAKRMKVGTAGFGTNPHMSGLFLEKVTGVKFDFVHAESGAKESMLIQGGHLDAILTTTGNILSAAEEGKARILGVMADKSTQWLEPFQVPTFRQQGYDVIYGAWRGVAVPRGTSDDIVETLHQAFKKALEEPQVQEQFTKAGYAVDYMSPAEAEKFIAGQATRMEEIAASLKE